MRYQGVKILTLMTSLPHIRVFSEIDHSANVARIVLVENTIGSVVELNFC